MSDSRTPSRRRRPALDPRLLIGIGLVVASVAGVVAVVGAADRRIAVYVAGATIAPGQHVDADDLVVRQVALDDAPTLYLTAADLPATGLVATSVIRRGELVPRAAVGSIEGSDSTALVLQLTGDVSESVIAGASVDVWASAAGSVDPGAIEDPGFGPPVVIVPDATVVRLLEDDGFVSASDGRSIEVLIPRSRIARVLQAIADGDALAVVPAGIPLSSR
ncbi:MAG: SAF domain-containing protein [Pseudolysinimonas sp.]